MNAMSFLHFSVENCQKRYRRLRQYYSKERTLRETNKKRKKWPLYEYMEYIDPFIPRKSKKSGIFLLETIDPDHSHTYKQLN